MSPAEGFLRRLRRVYRQGRIVDALQRESMSGREERVRVVHMLHVRKTGGTAVKAVLEHAQMPPDLRILTHGHGISLSKIPAEDDVFLFLREPVSRYASGFEMRRREGRPRHYRPWSADERRAFARFDSAETLALALGSSDRSAQAEAERAMRTIYHVRSHLSDWLVDEHEIRARRDRLVFIGWQERLDDDFAELVALLGLPSTTRLPDDEYLANRARREAQSGALSNDAVNIIRNWYARNYRLIRLLTDLGLTRPPAAMMADLE